MAKSTQTEFIARAFDPVGFCRSLGFEPDEWQADVLTTGAKRVCLLCSRQSGKSLVAQILALWTALFIPGSLVLIVSASLRQSTEMFRGILGLLSKTKDSGGKLVEVTKQQLTLRNGSRVISLPSSESTVRGYAKANLIIIDEAAQVEDSIYYSVRPMLSISLGRLLLLSTPSGASGFFWDTWMNGSSEWQKVQITAEQCPRISKDFLEEEKEAIGDIWFRQEYLTEFISDGECVFPAEYVNAAFSDALTPLFVVTS